MEISRYSFLGAVQLVETRGNKTWRDSRVYQREMTESILVNACICERQKTLHLEDDPNINAMEDTRSSQVYVYCHLTSRHQEGHLSYLPLKDAIENHDDLQFMSVLRSSFPAKCQGVHQGSLRGQY